MGERSEPMLCASSEGHRAMLEKTSTYSDTALGKHLAKSRDSNCKTVKSNHKKSQEITKNPGKFRDRGKIH